MNQRWLFRSSSFRPAEPIRTADYEVAEIKKDAQAKSFVLAHHYSGSYPAAKFRFGLFTRGQLVGAAVFSVPCTDLVLTGTFQGMPAEDGTDLGRFVLLDSVPGNGETWFLARCFELLRKEQIAGVVSFSDPEPRKTADGQTVFPGHIGTIYQAHNAVYFGRATPRTLRMLPDGSVLSARAISKLRARAKGWRYTAELLTAHGADEPGEDLNTWADHWLPLITRPQRHHGNHKYAWGLDKSARRLLPTSQPYPKMLRAA
jgi:hypothetical protein